LIEALGQPLHIFVPIKKMIVRSLDHESTDRMILHVSIWLKLKRQIDLPRIIREKTVHTYLPAFEVARLVVPEPFTIDKNFRDSMEHLYLCGPIVNPHIVNIDRVKAKSRR
jgi:hypothetical protein